LERAEVQTFLLWKNNLLQERQREDLSPSKLLLSGHRALRGVFRFLLQCDTRWFSEGEHQSFKETEAFQAEAAAARSTEENNVV